MAFKYNIRPPAESRLYAIENADLDPLMLLAQEIADHFLIGKQAAGATLIAPTVRIL